MTALETVDFLLRLRAGKGLRLVTTIGLPGFAYMDDHDPDALVAEVLRLARVGAVAEEIAILRPAAEIREALDRAQLVDPHSPRTHVRLKGEG